MTAPFSPDFDPAAHKKPARLGAPRGQSGE
ncbi:MAG: hypothetical protein QOC66_2469, partial [Pseudonocardiales bacterium]|nr:hypothetical protein [Pseudonocardiales bacterium]